MKVRKSPRVIRDENVFTRNRQVLKVGLKQNSKASGGVILEKEAAKIAHDQEKE